MRDPRGLLQLGARERCALHHRPSAVRCQSCARCALSAPSGAAGDHAGAPILGEVPAFQDKQHEVLIESVAMVSPGARTCAASCARERCAGECRCTRAARCPWKAVQGMAPGSAFAPLLFGCILQDDFFANATADNPIYLAKIDTQGGAVPSQRQAVTVIKWSVAPPPPLSMDGPGLPAGFDGVVLQGMARLLRQRAVHTVMLELWPTAMAREGARPCEDALLQLLEAG